MGATLAGIGVIAGAFGAHGLEKVLTPELLDTFEVSVRYQMYHSLGLILVGILAQRQARSLKLPAILFLIGMALFSGSLYLWVLTGVKLFAMITPPIGGTAFILGWFSLAIAVWRRDGTRIA